MLCYCKKCGRILFLFDNWEKTCDFCNNVVIPIPEQFLNSEYSINEDLKENFINNYIKTSPEFDQNLFDSREKKVKQHINDFEKQNARLEHGKTILEEQSHQPECPTCHSKNVQPISGIERGASIIGLGIFSKKINKSFKCKHCGYTW